MRNIQVLFTKTAHTLHPLGNYADNYICPVAKIQSSSLCVCTDSHMHRLYLFDISRPTLDRLNNETAGYLKDDLVVTSVQIRDDQDGDAVCADVCCDPSGYFIYALMLSREGKGAWVKVFKHLNRELFETGIRYAIPYDETPLQVVMRNDAPEYITDIPLQGHIGMPVIYQQLCYGAGIELYNGFLYIITRRSLPVELVTVAGYDVVLTSDIKTRYPVRLYEKRISTVQFSLLTVLNASSGACYGYYYLSQPDTVYSPQKKDAVFQGITWIEDKLITQVRYDRHVLPSKVELWHLQEAKVSLPPAVAQETYNSVTSTYDLPSIKAIVPVLYGQMPDPLPSVLFSDIAKVQRVIRRIKQIQANPYSGVPTLVTSTRGQSALVSLSSPIYGPSNSSHTYAISTRIAETSLLPYTILNNRFPWGVSMAYSLSADSAEKKLYGVYGNQLWVYDMMEYTLIIRYPTENGSYTFFEGDIVDMSDVTLLDRTELQCFLKNYSSATMEDVHLVVDLVSSEDDRAKEVFLSLSHGSTGYKDLALGSVPPGGSKEFWVEVHPQDIKEWEWHTTHTVPLQVIYTSRDDSY